MLVIQAKRNEQIVDAWFKTIARQVLEDGGEDASRGAGFIDTSKIDEDKTKVFLTN